VLAATTLAVRAGTLNAYRPSPSALVSASTLPDASSARTLTYLAGCVLVRAEYPCAVSDRRSYVTVPRTRVLDADGAPERCAERDGRAPLRPSSAGCAQDQSAESRASDEIAEARERMRDTVLPATDAGMDHAMMVRLDSSAQPRRTAVSTMHSKRSFISWLAVAVGLAATACGPRSTAGDGGAPLLQLADAACDGQITRRAEQESPHQTPGTVIPFRDNPPTNGPHYDVWARWGVYREVIPRGYWVHNLEHGGVVIAYRPDLSDAERDRLEAFVRALPPEPDCAAQGVRRRIIVTPDPELPARVAAVAWSHSYTADCVDTNALEQVVLGLTGRGPEQVCGDGWYPALDPDAGIPADAAHVRADASRD
jgi:hypothetical protein